MKANNKLYHHGIQGMKWGDRNGPPYPLSYDQHTSVEKRENRGKHSLSKYTNKKKSNKSVIRRIDNALYYKPKNERDAYRYSAKRAAKQAAISMVVNTAFMHGVYKKPLKECITTSAISAGKGFTRSVMIDAGKYRAFGRVDRDYLKIRRR